MVPLDRGRGWRADPPRVEVARLVTNQNLTALDKKRPPLLEDDLRSREIDHRRIRLHLSEVRVDRGIQREVGTDAHLDIASHPTLEIAPVVERIGRVWIARDGGSPGEVGKELDAPGVIDRGDPPQLTEA